MAKRKKKSQEGEQTPAQQYDTTFKDWIRQNAREVLPLFLPGAIYEDTLDVEVIRPTMRTDKVFRIRFEGLTEQCIVDVEFETSPDGDLPSRLIVYNAALYHQYRLPVITLVMYPFQAKKIGSPFTLRIGNMKPITFEFCEVVLPEEQAQHYVDEQIHSMYPILPTMQGVDHRLLRQAMDELAAVLGERVFAEQFVWMELLLDRTQTISEIEKEHIRKELNVYDSLWESHPRVKAIRAEVAKEKAEIKAEGEVQVAQRIFIHVVEARFPALAELAQEKVTHVANPDALDLLVQQISTAPDEKIARWLLSSPTAQ